MLAGALDAVSAATTGLEATGSGRALSVTSSFVGYSRPSSGEVDAITAIRFKTYGLHEMVLEKVRALDDLERAVSNQVTFDGGGVAIWKGELEALLRATGSSFGVTGVANNGAYAWMSWFERRFLPTYLAYRTALFSITR